MAGITLLYVTCPDEDVAARIGRALVEERLAACVNILPGMRSIYRWEGRVDEAQEAVLVVKTTAHAAAVAQARATALHPYQVPCVLQVPVADGHPPYLAWLAAAAEP